MQNWIFIPLVWPLGDFQGARVSRYKRSSDIKGVEITKFRVYAVVYRSHMWLLLSQVHNMVSEHDLPPIIVLKSTTWVIS
jgi:hypothetical protein